MGFSCSAVSAKKATCYYLLLSNTAHNHQTDFESSPSVVVAKKQLCNQKSCKIFNQSGRSPKKPTKFPMKNPSFACVTKVWVTKNSISKQNLRCFCWRKSQPATEKKPLNPLPKNPPPGIFLLRNLRFSETQKKKKKLHLTQTYIHQPTEKKNKKNRGKNLAAFSREKRADFWMYFPTTNQGRQTPWTTGFQDKNLPRHRTLDGIFSLVFGGGRRCWKMFGWEKKCTPLLLLLCVCVCLCGPKN